MSRSIGFVSSIPGVIEDIETPQIKYSCFPLRIRPSSISELIDSIRESGLLQPIVVRPKNTDFEIVAGNRRCKACESLQWRKIPCHIVELDDKAAFECSIVENLQRETLSAIEEAQAFKTYMENSGWGGISELAKKIGKSCSYVTKRIKLLDLPTDIITSIANSSLKSSLAEELLPIKDLAKQSELASLISKRHLSLRKTRQIVSQYKESEGKTSGLNILQERQKAFDKMILIFRIALNQTGQLIEFYEDDWMIYNILMQHRNVLHEQIDLLLKEKRKMSSRLAWV
jgi:ParB family chromosome partitioning protein